MSSAVSSVVVDIRPGSEKRTVGGGSRKANDKARGRKYLTRSEVHAIAKCARQRQRNGERDALMIRLAFEHGLRASELVNLQWQAVMFETQSLSVTRAKGSISCTHPLQGATMRALRSYHRSVGKPTVGALFNSERGAPVSVDGFRRMFGRVSRQVMGKTWNPHALRHACGYHLINSGQNIRTVQHYMGHANIQNTVLYTTLSARQFDGVTF